MDNQIRSSMRVIRKLDNADELIQRFPEWERSALSQDAVSSLTPQDQRRILDFPDAETQAANIANSSTLSREDLLRRAAETPTQLSATEVSLLKNRYWLDISPDEEHEVCLASGLVMGPHRVSEEEDYEEAGRRLEAVRKPFYAENEEKAIENGLAEHWRRGTDAWRARQRHEAERSLPMSFPWVRRLWEEDRGEKRWGYGIFVDPEAFVDDEESESYLIRRDGVLFHARGAIGAGSSAINNMWQLQTLDWPTSTTADSGEKSGGSQIVQQSDSKEDSNNPAADEVRREKEGIDQETDEKRAAKFEDLRQHFNSKRQRREQAASRETTQAESGGLKDGILQNVFLVVDKCSAGSVLSGPGLVDDMWVWAVDPDYDDANDASATAAEGSTSIETPSNYRGFMRVRLQQTVNKFYDARRFHEDDYPMARLWEAAQKSKHHAFVSPKDDEARSWSMDRCVGSLMRAQPPRIVYGPKPVVPARIGADQHIKSTSSGASDIT